MKIHTKCFGSVFCCVLCALYLIGCAGINLEQVHDIGIYTVLELAGALTRLLSLDYQDNMDGLQQLEEKYGVELTEPTTFFFEAAKAEIKALKELRQAMFEQDRSRTPSEGDKELEQLIEELDDLILRYDPERATESLDLAASQ